MAHLRRMWWDLDKSDPKVSRWVADGYRYPWCYDVGDTVHLLSYTRNDQNEVLWAGSECGIDEVKLLDGKPQWHILRRFVPTCVKCIRAFDKRGGKV